jgi:hypothetical protein
MDGVVSTRLLVPDAKRSTPLPNERPDERLMDPILLIDASGEAAARRAAEAASRILGSEHQVTSAILNMMWHLRKSDLGLSRPERSYEAS